MTLFEDDPTHKQSQHLVGSDLSLLSVDELSERISQLQAEIKRIEAERVNKSSSMKAADALFKF
jgi:uncharacterized small protein (DUF1192 family)